MEVVGLLVGDRDGREIEVAAADLDEAVVVRVGHVQIRAARLPVVPLDHLELVEPGAGLAAVGRPHGAAQLEVVGLLGGLELGPLVEPAGVAVQGRAEGGARRSWGGVVLAVPGPRVVLAVLEAGVVVAVPGAGVVLAVLEAGWCSPYRVPQRPLRSLAAPGNRLC